MTIKAGGLFDANKPDKKKGCDKTTIKSKPWVKVYKRATDKHPAGVKYRSRVCAGQDLQKNPKVIAWREALKEMHDFHIKGTSGTFTTHRKKKGFSRRDADRKHILKKDIKHMTGKKVARPKLLIPKKGTAAYKKIKARMAVILREMSAPRKKASPPRKKPEYLYKLAPSPKKKAAPRKKPEYLYKLAPSPKKKAAPRKKPEYLYKLAPSPKKKRAPPKKKPEYLYKLAPSPKKKRAPPKKKASPPKKKASPVKTGPRRSSRLAARR
jgi:hypothetical protein